MNKRKGLFLLLIVLLVVTVGFALLSRKLNIFGTSNITAASWNIHWDNVANQKGVEASTPAYIKDTKKTIVEYEVNFLEPGDYYEFTVDAVNEGTMDGKITKIESTVNGEDISTLPSYITYSVSYLEGGTPALGDILTKKVGNTPGKKTYKIRVEYDADLVTETDLDDMPNDGLTLVFEYDVTYSQADPMEVEPVSFADDPWDVIAEEGNEAAKQEEVNNFKCGVYNVGDTKEIEMDLDGDNTPETYKVRIANCSTPAICSTTGYSQTACGFVVEFEEVFLRRIMNPNGGSGGWKDSDMRAYLNNGKYAEDTANEIDYSTTGFISKLPVELKDNLKNTTVISGHSSSDNANYTTTDKLYLLASREVWGDGGVTEEVDSAYNTTHQLDYYKGKGVTVTNYANARKTSTTYNAWYLRSLNKYDSDNYFAVDGRGHYYFANGIYDHGTSPAFKLR